MFLIRNVSKINAWFSSTNRREVLCWKFARTLATLRCSLARRLRAFSRFLPPIFLRDSALSLLELLHCALERLGRFDFLAVRTSAEGFDADVQPQHLRFTDCRLKRDLCLVVVIQNGRPVIAASIHGQGDALHLAVDLSMDHRLDGFHLWHLDEVIANGNPGAVIARLFRTARLEMRKSPFLLEEAGKSRVQVSNGLL